MLRVYYANLGGLELRPALFPLSDYRLERLEKLKTERSIRQSLGAELLLIRAICQLDTQAELPLEIAAGENGKPFFPGKDLYFSLSHSDDLALCALSDRELGADVQRQRPYNVKLARRFFTGPEQAYLQDAEYKD